MRFFFAICFLLCFLSVSAQQAANADESKRMVEQVCAAAGEMKSLECDFLQVKQLSLLQTAMTSKGKMYYKGGKLLCWQYTSPYTYTFVLNNDKVMLKSSEKTDVVSVRSSKMFQQIARIMMNSITGRCLSDTEDFNVTMYGGDHEWRARLVPKQKELAQLFDYITLFIDPKLQMVTVVELVEKGGDTTRIEMKNVKKNAAIDDEVFAIE